MFGVSATSLNTRHLSLERLGQTPCLPACLSSWVAAAVPGALSTGSVRVIPEQMQDPCIYLATQQTVCGPGAETPGLRVLFTRLQSDRGTKSPTGLLKL